ncbi:MAG TPA: aminoglycoside phosphotransferase family protein [Ilumatobacteraceae bacterium]
MLSSPADVERFLTTTLGLPATSVHHIGSGAWSECYAFRSDGFDYVIKTGPYLDDFERDRIAASYMTPDLPIPRTMAIGNGLDGYYAVSSRVFGAPLESCSADEWRDIVPAIAAALEAMRTAKLVGTGWGGWDLNGNAPHPTWRNFLLTVGEDGPDRRTHGWRVKLENDARRAKSFASFFDLLAETATDDVPRSLTHGDLINRNVHVASGGITGIFDWGCSRYGDCLYDLAWFEFWQPWHSNLDVTALRTELQRRWQDSGASIDDAPRRELACLLHIGLDHLAYNAYLDYWDVYEQVHHRLIEIVDAR